MTTDHIEFPAYSVRVADDVLTVCYDGREWVRLAMRVTVEKEGARDYDTGLVSYEKTEKDGAYELRFVRGSSAWEEKTVICRLDGDGFSFYADVKGDGRVGEVRFFEGAKDDKTFGASPYEFTAYTVPFTDFFSHEHRTHNVIEPYSFDFQIFNPPLFVYSFRHAASSRRFGLGLYGQDGDWNFIRFDYSLSRRRPFTGFKLSTDFEYHRQVSGTFRTPEIRAFFAPDDMAVFRAYGDYFRATHPDSPSPRRDRPDFWYGPIICGWQEQYVYAAGTEFDADHYARESVYRAFADKVLSAGLCPKILIIDDKWQKEYGTATPDPEKWRDLRGFIDEMHEKGIHTLLWYKLWAGNGLPDDEVITKSDATPYGTMSFDESPYCDPSNPKWQRRLRTTLHTLLSSDEGCFNADGFKIDFAFMMPRGKAARSYTGQYGVELLREQMRLIYTIAKEIKPDCLINASHCNPYFAGLCDQVRLHDYDDSMRDYEAEMTYRREIFEIGQPGLLIDTDNPCYGSHDSCMRALQAQPSIGVPDLYRISGNDACAFCEEDFAVIREIWERYEQTIRSAKQI